jgi:hypothetical protein
MYRRAVSNERPEGVVECRDHVSTPPERDDPDPVIKTLLTFADGFVVTHITRSGKIYTRGDQYRDVRIWTDEGTHWPGIWKRNPNKRMTGSLSYEGNAARYVEKVYDGGRLETTITSTCENAS